MVLAAAVHQWYMGRNPYWYMIRTTQNAYVHAAGFHGISCGPLPAYAAEQFGEFLGPRAVPLELRSVGWDPVVPLLEQHGEVEARRGVVACARPGFESGKGRERDARGRDGAVRERPWGEI